MEYFPASPTTSIICSTSGAGTTSTLAPCISPLLERTVPVIIDSDFFSYSPTLKIIFLEEIPPLRSVTTTLITNMPASLNDLVIVGWLRYSGSAKGFSLRYQA